MGLFNPNFKQSITSMSGGDECLDLGVAGAESVDKLSALVILNKPLLSFCE